MKENALGIYKFAIKYKYIVTGVVFAVWLLLFDETNYSYKAKLEDEVSSLKKEKKYFIDEIEKNKKRYESFNKKEVIEKFAREEYYMKKPNEDVFVIVEKEKKGNVKK